MNVKAMNKRFKRKTLGASDSIAILLPHAKHTGDTWMNGTASVFIIRKCFAD
jgi:hypothetical protein